MADNLAISMTNRGYGANKSWTDMIETHPEVKDYIVMVIFAILLTGAFVVRYRFGLGLI